jgi:hypothetical protein
MPNTYLFAFRTHDGALIRVAKVPVTTVAGQANTVAHGLPAAPLAAIYAPTSGNGNWYETQAPDATNVYITVGASGPTSFTVICLY